MERKSNREVMIAKKPIFSHNRGPNQFSELKFDEISREIIRRFQWPRGESSKYISKPSVYRMAKELQVHPKVIRSRISNLFESGVIREVRFYADSKFVPWNRYFILCNSSASFPQEIYNHFRELPFVERVIFGTIKLPKSSIDNDDLTMEKEFSSISLISSDDSDMKVKKDFIEQKLGWPLNIMEVTNDSPRKEKLLTHSEHSILNVILYQNPLSMSIADIAQKLKIPARTVRRKVEKMLEEGVIYEEVSLDTSMTHGVLLPSIIMTGDYQKWLPTIYKSKFLHERLLLYKNWSRFSFFIFYAETFSVIDQLIRDVKAIDPASMITYRNGSYNNPFVRYPKP